MSEGNRVLDEDLQVILDIAEDDTELGIYFESEPEAIVSIIKELQWYRDKAQRLAYALDEGDEETQLSIVKRLAHAYN